jgi:hypothetical protein
MMLCSKRCVSSYVIFCCSHQEVKARARWDDKKSWVGKEGMKIVSNFLIRTKSFPGNLSVKDYVAYALREDGPALFAKPGPHNNPYPDEEGYVMRSRDDTRSYRLISLYYSVPMVSSNPTLSSTL